MQFPSFLASNNHRCPIWACARLYPPFFKVLFHGQLHSLKLILAHMIQTGAKGYCRQIKQVNLVINCMAKRFTGLVENITKLSK